MQSLRRMLPLLALVATGAFVVACTTTRKPPQATAQKSQPARGMYKVGNPYQIDGVWYYPAEDLSYEETGIGSWYGEAFHAKDTANGEVFDLNAMTAAHRTLPMPSIVQVTNLENGRTVQLRVNDRGPFARGRIIDVSRRAAQLLGFEQSGTAKMRVKVLVPETLQAVALARRNGADGEPVEMVKAAPRESVVAQALPPPGAAPLPAPVPAPPPKTTLQQLAGVKPSGAPPRPAEAAKPADPLPQLMPPEKVSVVAVRPTQIYIQAGAFSRPDNATRVKQRLEPLGQVAMSGTQVGGVSMWRVRLGPIESVDDADRLLARVVESGLPEARIVVD